MKKLTIIFSIFCLPTFAQNTNADLGNWLMYFGQNRVSDKISIHTEVQYRNHTVTPNNTEQLLLRIGINYHLKTATITGGYGHIGSHVYLSEKKATYQELKKGLMQQLLTGLVRVKV